VLGQLGESRLVAAIDTDLAGEQSHSKALDADTKGPLRDIHRRVGTAILFEFSGGQTDKVAHLSELRFAISEPELDTTTIDSAVSALEDRSFLVGTIPPKCGTTSARKYFPLRSGLELKIGLGFSVTVSADSANGLTTDLRQILQDELSLNLGDGRGQAAAA